MRISDWSSDVCSSDLAGLTAPLHLTADGKALLARMTSAEVSAWLGEDLPPRTDRSKGLGALLTELEDIRRSGFAYDDEEHTEGVSAISVSIGTYRGAYAITIIAPDRKSTRLNSSH